MYMHSLAQFRNPSRLRMARSAVMLYFFANGVMTATFPARIPEIQARLALSPAQLGFALLGAPVGALMAMNMVGPASRRFGSRAITISAALCMCLALPLLAIVPGLPWLTLAMLLLGAGNGGMEVTMNLQGVTVEHEYGKPILSYFHACFSLGSLAGAFFGGIMAAVKISPLSHFLIVCLLASVAVIYSARFLLSPVQAGSSREKRRAWPPQFSLLLSVLGLMAFCVLLSEGAMFDWSALYLSGVAHSGAAVGATGFALFTLFMALGRGFGDYITTRLDAALVVRLASLLAASGLALALTITRVPAVLVGLSLVGIGLSILFPLLVSAAGRSSQQDKGSSIALLSTCGYLGVFVGPP
ncbi:MFS transporter [Dictyobacter kobayashii]|uniref:MFS transporter n=1 Tax=Dictyobacter kobayashii TaxID=2014872 RepID=A0A402AQP3_9CHLR|nr:MFS transporter [Dictyobacter kobayashii]GCE21395.1 MFS transporter [Dictyobacter kobayashii]